MRAILCFAACSFAHGSRVSRSGQRERIIFRIASVHPRATNPLRGHSHSPQLSISRELHFISSCVRECDRGSAITTSSVFLFIQPETISHIELSFSQKTIELKTDHRRDFLVCAASSRAINRLTMPL